MLRLILPVVFYTCVISSVRAEEMPVDTMDVYGEYITTSPCTPPGAAATLSGILTCINNTVTLMGTSPTAGVSYAWIGPEGFTATAQTITVSVQGVYILTVTTPENDCASSATVVVQPDQVAPGVVVTACDGALTCSTTSVSLGALSPTPGAMYHWTGPDGYASTEQNPVTTIPGSYTVTVTNPTNGCTSSAEKVVQQQAEVLGSVAATVSGRLTCTVNNVTLMGASTIPGGIYQWTGPNGFTAAAQHVSTSVPGEYTLTVTSNGCSASATVAVLQDIAVPNAGAVNNTGTSTLTCHINPIILTGHSSTAGAVFKWTGPNGFESSNALINVRAPGAYVFRVTGPNGCTRVLPPRNITQVLVTISATASVSGVINCNTPSVVLSGSSSSSSVTYSWAGPAGFTSTLQNPVVDASGAYTLTTTTTGGGCTATANISVEKNITEPANVTATVSGVLNCEAGFVTLQGASSSAGAVYLWRGPNGYESTEGNALTTQAGEYTLTVTHPSSSCQVTKNVTVLSEACTN